ncbi:MAG: hypothetical protein Q8896_01775 [Bacteroidota bacterium]|nr:hypothetical protein [Bacteroidota bacterium]
MEEDFELATTTNALLHSVNLHRDSMVIYHVTNSIELQQMATWLSILKYDPLPPLLASENKAIAFFAERDLVGKKKTNVKLLWDLPDAQRIVRKQQKNGSWKYPKNNANVRSPENYDQIETFRNLGYLVEMYGFDRSSPIIQKAAEFFFGFQTKEGDIRGILGNQYGPYYTGAILELLIKAGYADDKRTEKVFAWLSCIRQDDGGWAIPMRTLNKKLVAILKEPRTLEPDRSKPFSHMVTGMVLRAYAAHPQHRKSREAQEAGKLLLSNLFKKDHYPDRSSAALWLRFSFPFWFTDLISATDSLSLLGFSTKEPEMIKAIDWFVSKQSRNGLWQLSTLRNKKYESELWVSLATCRIVKRLYS